MNIALKPVFRCFYMKFFKKQNLSQIHEILDRTMYCVPCAGGNFRKSHLRIFFTSLTFQKLFCRKVDLGAGVLLP